MYFEKIASDKRLRLDQEDLIATELLPESIKRKGAEPEDRSDMHWMTYENHTKTELPFSYSYKPGTISVTRNLSGRLLDTVGRLTEVLTQAVGYTFDAKEMQLMRTRGCVFPHRGGTRATSLNIGLFGSNLALTMVSTNDRLEDFDPLNRKTENYIQQDGNVYLLNVSKFHAVETIDLRWRYQLTYGFQESYDQVLSLLRSINNEPTSQ